MHSILPLSLSSRIRFSGQDTALPVPRVKDFGVANPGSDLLKPYGPSVDEYLGSHFQGKEVLTLDEGAQYFFEEPFTDLPGRLKFFIENGVDTDHDKQLSRDELVTLDYRLEQLAEKVSGAKPDSVVTLEELQGGLGVSHRRYLYEQSLGLPLSPAEQDRIAGRLQEGRFTASRRKLEEIADLEMSSGRGDSIIYGYKTVQAARNFDEINGALEKSSLQRWIPGVREQVLKLFAEGGNMPFLEFLAEVKILFLELGQWVIHRVEKGQEEDKYELRPMQHKLMPEGELLEFSDKVSLHTKENTYQIPVVFNLLKELDEPWKEAPLIWNYRNELELTVSSPEFQGEIRKLVADIQGVYSDRDRLLEAVKTLVRYFEMTFETDRIEVRDVPVKITKLYPRYFYEHTAMGGDLASAIRREGKSFIDIPTALYKALFVDYRPKTGKYETDKKLDSTQLTLFLVEMVVEEVFHIRQALLEEELEQAAKKVGIAFDESDLERIRAYRKNGKNYKIPLEQMTIQGTAKGYHQQIIEADAKFLAKFVSGRVKKILDAKTIEQ